MCKTTSDLIKTNGRSFNKIISQHCNLNFIFAAKLPLLFPVEEYQVNPLRKVINQINFMNL